MYEDKNISISERRVSIGNMYVSPSQIARVYVALRMNQRNLVFWRGVGMAGAAALGYGLLKPHWVSMVLGIFALLASVYFYDKEKRAAARQLVIETVDHRKVWIESRDLNYINRLQQMIHEIMRK